MEYIPIVLSFETQLISLFDHTVIYPRPTWWIVHTVQYYYTPYHNDHVMLLLSPIVSPSPYRIYLLALNHHVHNTSLIIERYVASRRYYIDAPVTSVNPGAAYHDNHCPTTRHLPSINTVYKYSPTILLT